jgi:hypothetical protein
MDQLERSNRIKSSLILEPIIHGKIHISQITIPEPEKQILSKERSELIEASLREHQSNLFSLIIRRTKSYSEDQNYEIVYGADWYFVAKQLGIEMLWAWVFDLTDEQAAATKAEMERLAGSKSEPVTLDEKSVSLIGKKLEAIQQENYQRHQEEFEKLQNSFQEKFSQLEQKIDELKKTRTEKVEKRNKINLVTATKPEVEQALASVGASTTAIKVAWKAIEYWRQLGKLTWSNLEKSHKTGSKDNIPNFGKATYEKLREIGEIEDSEKPSSS